MRSLMIQGTGSNVGKSVFVAGLARAFARQGVKVFPFKPQNMSNNAAVTSDHGEIGRAQALQAWAAKCVPHTDMNPVLLKPETETGAQIILQGKRLGQFNAAAYNRMKATLLPSVLESYHRLCAQADLVLVEGAGSPAEVNLRKNDIANMGFANATNLPVILIGDIDRGGVIAQLIGTKAVISARDNSHIKGFIVNKFRGNKALFATGYEYIKTQTSWRGLGVCPWFEGAQYLPYEDALDISANMAVPAGTKNNTRTDKKMAIGCLQFQRIANFDDLDPLKTQKNISLTMIKAGQPIPGNLDMVILPGSKSTIADLAFLRMQGWDIDLLAHLRRKGKILGLCGGYQMLGKTINDPKGIEGTPGMVEGLGLLDVETELTQRKRLNHIEAIHTLSGEKIAGYEIHIGRTYGQDCTRPFALIDQRNEGAISPNGLVTGTYLHGVFSADRFRKAYFQNFGIKMENQSYTQIVDETIDRLAEHIKAHCNLDEIFDIATQKIT